MAITTSRDKGTPPNAFQVGVVSYNGYTFPNLINAKISARMVMDSAERIVKYVTYDIEITTVVVGSDPILNEDAGSPNSIVKDNIEDIRKRLSEPGQFLSFTAQGFGDFEINESAGGVRDIKFGPKPRILAWEPIGSNKAVRIVWACETSIPECKKEVGTPQYAHSLMNFEYEVEWAINESGMTERRIIGEFEIPVSWGTNNKLTDTADRYRHILERVPVLAGYARSHPLLNLSKDRSVLTFTILDREIPSDNAYHPGMIDMNVSHSLKTSLMPVGEITGTGGFVKWNSTIFGTVEVAPGYPKELAWWAITAIVTDRLRHALYSTYTTTGEKETKLKSFLLLNLSLTEEVFGRSVSFSVGFLLYGSPDQMLGSQGLSGLFQPLSTTWVEWNASVYNQVHNARGYAQLGHTTADDIKITLCDNNLPVKGSDPTTVSDQRLTAVFETPCPPPEASWIDYHSWMDVTEDTDVIFHKPLVDKSAEDLVDTENIDPDPSRTIGFTFTTDTGGEVEESQVRTSPRYKVVLYGWAVRLGYKIDPPGLASVGGVKAIPIKKYARDRILKSGKCSIHRLKWRIEYRLESAPLTDLHIAVQTGADVEKFQ